MAFTPHGETTVEVCFENILESGYSHIVSVLIEGRSPGIFRTVELDVDIGSAGFDYAALQKAEVKP